MASNTIITTERLIYGSTEILVNPERWLDLAQLGTSATMALGKLLLILPDRKTIFKGDCGVPKSAAWSNPIPLGLVKAIGKEIDATVNDVLLTAVTGALRRYLEEHGEKWEGINIRAVVPVNLRQPKEVNKLGNRFGLIFLSLPVGVKDPIQRLLVLKHRMDAIKDTPEAAVAFGILTAIGMTPVQIEDIIIKIFAMKGTAVMTNVPGPRQQLYMAGQPIRDFMFWVPTPGQLGLGVSILSYNGGVNLGVMTDTGLIPDPETIVQGFYTELEEMAEWVEPSELAAGKSKPEPEQVEEVIPPEEMRENRPQPEVSHCQGRTKTGQPCKNPALPGSSFCRVHQPKRCQAFTQAGQPCKNLALRGSKFCRVHQSNIE